MGTGDGSFAYNYAHKNPSVLVIGVDACLENLQKISAKAARKPAKGGLSNVLFVCASAQELPDELTGRVDHVYINFPWGTLLQGVILARAELWSQIRKLCTKNARVEILTGYDSNRDAKEITRLGLPELNEHYITSTLAPKLAGLGFELIKFEKIAARELKNYPTTWAKKLAFGRERDFYRITLRSCAKQESAPTCALNEL